MFLCICSLSLGSNRTGVCTGKTGARLWPIRVYQWFVRWICSVAPSACCRVSHLMCHLDRWGHRGFQAPHVTLQDEHSFRLLLFAGIKAVCRVIDLTDWRLQWYWYKWTLWCVLLTSYLLLVLIIPPRSCGLPAVSLCFLLVGTTNPSDSDWSSAPTAG